MRILLAVAMMAGLGAVAPAVADEVAPAQSLLGMNLAGPADMERMREAWAFIAGAAKRPDGAMVAVATSAVEPWPHQLRAYKRMLDNWPFRLLIADEVGLGKTIEAGLMIRHAWISGLAKRILILTPAGILKQWQAELYEKFNLLVPIYTGNSLVWPEHHFRTFPLEQKIDRKDWTKQPLVLASSHLMRRRDRQAELLEAEGWDLTGRLHPRAALYAPPPAPRAGTRGRRRKRGVRLPSPVEMLTRGSAEVVTLDLYGRHERARVATAQALWYATAGSRLLRIVAVEPRSTGRPRQAFYSTCAEAPPVQVLPWFARRWALEVTIHEAKQYLGFEEPQGWTRRAVERTAPVAMLLYSLIVLWFAREGHRQVSFPNRPWYRQKREPSFADMLAALRRACLRQTFLQTPVWDRRSKKIIQSLVALCSSSTRRPGAGGSAQRQSPRQRA